MADDVRKEPIGTEETPVNANANDGANADAGNITDDTIAATSPEPQTNVEGQAQPVAGDTGTDAFDPVRELANVIVSDPVLYDKVENTIREHFGLLGGNRTAANAQSQPKAEANVQIDQQSTQPAADPQVAVLEERLRRMEQFIADLALREELNQAKQAYNEYKKHLPVLPDLDERELLQLAGKYPGLPLQEVAWQLVKQKLLSGDQPAAERIFKIMMEQSAVKDVPPVEKGGGNIPDIPPEEPTSFRAARRSVRDLIAMLNKGITGM